LPTDCAFNWYRRDPTVEDFAMPSHMTGKVEDQPATLHPTHVTEPELPRSGYGLTPGAELPGAVYVAVLLAYVWMLSAAWLAFGSSEESDLNLGIATVLTIVIFALPVLIVRTARSRSRKRADTNTVGTATGELPMSEACVQILLLPFVLAIAATAFGLTYFFVG
jgi:hypothetical protein